MSGFRPRGSACCKVRTSNSRTAGAGQCIEIQAKMAHFVTGRNEDEPLCSDASLATFVHLIGCDVARDRILISPASFTSMDLGQCAQEATDRFSNHALLGRTTKVSAHDHQRHSLASEDIGDAVIRDLTTRLRTHPRHRGPRRCGASRNPERSRNDLRLGS